MFLATGRAGGRRVFSRSLQILSLLALVSIPTAAVNAQGGIESTGTGGNNKIQGRIYFPSGRRSDATAVRVTLESSSSERLSVIADLNGSFTFQSLAPGSYYLTVDAGEDYEPSRETVIIEKMSVRSRSLSGSDLARLNVPRIFSVMISLRPKRGRIEGKTGVVNAALAGVPRPAAELYEKAREAAEAGDTKKAVELLRAAVSYYPEFALAYNELGVLYLRAGQPDKAVEAFRTSLRIKPDEFSPRLNYGIALLEKKEAAEAEVQLRKAVEKNDASWPAHMYLGLALISLRNYDEAEKELLRTLSLGGDNLSLPHYYLGGIYWRRGDHKRAAEELEKYLRLAPKAPDGDRIRATIKDLRSKGGQG